MPEKMSVDKRTSLAALGAQLEIVPNAPLGDPDNFQSVARRLAAEHGWFLADQFCNPANPLVHERTTGPEILAQAGGAVGAFVAGAGTGGTITGVGRYLRRAAPGARIVLADPLGSGLADWVEHGVAGPDTGYRIEGIGAGAAPAVMERGVIDAAERIPDDESFAMVGRLLREEGLLVGGSAGTAVAAAVRVARAGGLDGPGRRAAARQLGSLPLDRLAAGAIGRASTAASSFFEDAGGCVPRIAGDGPQFDAMGMWKILRSSVLVLALLACAPAVGQAADRTRLQRLERAPGARPPQRRPPRARPRPAAEQQCAARLRARALRRHAAAWLFRAQRAEPRRSTSASGASSTARSSARTSPGARASTRRRKASSSLWMHSAPHRRIILMSSLHRVGLGVATGSFQRSSVPSWQPPTSPPDALSAATHRRRRDPRPHRARDHASARELRRSGSRRSRRACSRSASCARAARAAGSCTARISRPAPPAGARTHAPAHGLRAAPLAGGLLRGDPAYARFANRRIRSECC